MKTRILDLFCCAGGASKGYLDAGFDEVVGVDNVRQKQYPYEFILSDAIEFLESGRYEGFDAIHASPPCQAYSDLRTLQSDVEHPDLVSATRAALDATGLPYVIENVENAPLIDPITLCGSSFGLRVRRHRLFESNIYIQAKPCEHEWQNRSRIYTVRRYHFGTETAKAGVVGVYGGGKWDGPGEVEEWKKQMGIDWMSRRKLTQAIPPAYAEHIGRQLLAEVNKTRLLT